MSGVGGGAGHALPDVLGALAHAVDRAARGLQHLAGAADDLPGDQERDQHVGQPGELAVPCHTVVLVAAVGVAGRVGVVLEQVDVAGDALLVQPALGVHQQALEDALARLVVHHQIDQVVALGRGVLRVGADVEVQPGAVAQEHVRAAAPGHHPSEQVAGHLVRREPALAVERTGDAVLVLDAEDAPVHGSHPRCRSSSSPGGEVSPAAGSVSPGSSRVASTSARISAWDAGVVGGAGVALAGCPAGLAPAGLAPAGLASAGLASAGAAGAAGAAGFGASAVGSRPASAAPTIRLNFRVGRLRSSTATSSWPAASCRGRLFSPPTEPSAFTASRSASSRDASRLCAPVTWEVIVSAWPPITTYPGSSTTEPAKVSR